MALQAKRHSKTAKRTRRGAIKLKKLALTACAKCKTMIKPHQVCYVCGNYKGREVIKIKIKKGKKNEKK